MSTHANNHNDELQKSNVELREQNIHLQNTITQLQQRDQIQEQRIQYLIRQLFGSKSETINPDQLLLFDTNQEATTPVTQATPSLPAAPEKNKATQQKKRENKLRRSLEKLPTTIQELTPAEVLADPEAYKRIGEERSEKLHVRPALYSRTITIRGKYVRLDHPHQAPINAVLPPSLLEGSILTPSLAADILTKKYLLHIPLYRQEWVIKNAHELAITRQHLCHWSHAAIRWLSPIYEQIRLNLIKEDYLQGDETTINYLDPGSGKKQIGYLWVIHNPQVGIYYHWSPSRAHSALDEILKTAEHHPPWEGKLQSDAYAAYQTWINKQPSPDKIKRAGCWAHVRRKFFDAHKLKCKHSDWILRQIQHLYRIESELRKKQAGKGNIQAKRQSESAPIVKRIIARLRQLENKSGILPRSALGIAINYTLKQTKELQLYLEHGEVQIDNNLIENGMRPVKLGQKNWLFLGNKESGKNAAIIYTIIENCRRNQIDPQAYLEWVLTELPKLSNQTNFNDYLPSAWAKNHRAQKIA